MTLEACPSTSSEMMVTKKSLTAQSKKIESEEKSRSAPSFLCPIILNKTFLVSLTLCLRSHPMQKEGLSSPSLVTKT